MRRINTPDGLYHNADPVAGEAGTIVTAESLNAIQEEIVAVITAAGITLDPADNAQLLAAIQSITGGGIAWGAITGKPATATRWPVWDEVDEKPWFGSASLANVDDFATAAQGVKADAALPANGGTAVNTLFQTPNDGAANIALRVGANDVNKQMALVAYNGKMRWDYSGNLWYGSGSMSWAFAGVDKMTLSKAGDLLLAGCVTTPAGSANGLVIERSAGNVGVRIWKDSPASDIVYFDQANGADIVFRTSGNVERLRISASTGAVSISSLVAAGAITGASVRSTGTIMAAGGFQIG